jgi:hypothetical protein
MQYKYFKGGILPRKGGGVSVEIVEDTGAFYNLNRLWRPYCSRWFNFDSVEDLKTFINYLVLAVREYEEKNFTGLGKASEQNNCKLPEVMVGAQEK